MLSNLAVPEDARLEALGRYELDLLGGDPEFSGLATLAASVCHTPMAFIDFVESDRVLVKASVGLNLRVWPRQDSFAASAVSMPDRMLIVQDARRDARFCKHPMVASEPHVRFVAAAPLLAPSGHAIGSIWVADLRVRALADREREGLRLLAEQVMRGLELRHTVHRLSGEICEHSRFEREMLRTKARPGTPVLQDSLTGLGNRRAFEKQLISEVQRADRLAYPLSVLTIDVDRTRSTNDEEWHVVGDEVVREVGRRLAAIVRTTDFVARVGKDEFALILPGTHKSGAMVLAERCRRAMEAVRPSVSISDAFAEHPHDTPHILQIAGRDGVSLLSARRLDRNRIVGRDHAGHETARAATLAH